MKITETRVKTFYTLDLEFKDFSKIFCEAKTDEWRHRSEMGEFNLNDTTMGNIRDCFYNLQEPKTVEYIVRKLGFDGVENYGQYNSRKGVYTLVVYDNGDLLNGTYNISR